MLLQGPGPAMVFSVASRRASPLCSACQNRQAHIGLQRTAVAKRRRIGTTIVPTPSEPAVTHEDFTVRRNDAIRPREDDAEDHNLAGKDDETNKSRRLAEAVDNAMQTELKEFEAIWTQGRDRRLQVLRSLSNPWPDQSARQPRRTKDSKPQLPEANAAPVSHEQFRVRLAKARGTKAIRSILTHQLIWCETPSAIRRVVATAMVTSRLTQLELAALHSPISRALYRIRKNVDDHEVMRTLIGINSRFRIYGVPFHQQLLNLSLKFAARTRNLRLMKRYLKALRDSDEAEAMNSNLFRAVVAKCSIGHRGLGEIRNGRWKRHELHQICVGFPECAHLPPDKQYHLGAWLNRNDWQYLHGYIAVLARCRDVPRLWSEWELWKMNAARTRPRRLKTDHELETTKMRGDYWFLEQMTYSGGLKEAWMIFEETGIEFSVLSFRIRMKLLDGIEHATVWNEAIRAGMLLKYDHELKKIERALGVSWDITPAESGHVLVKDQHEVMEALGSDDWKLEEDYGYPLDDGTKESQEEAARTRLHDAVETGPAEVAILYNKKHE